ncbi:DUF4394 domain-containing protein [uncultured Sphingomonas sp.]|uniref:DUF4394 domain-containing protein n=1 Tax=uncultured Sphingomonas sp. TaxID=158754 RepID=UPI0035CBE8A8
MKKKVMLFAAMVGVTAASSGQAATIFGVDGLNNLVTFDSAAPSTFTSSVRITGIADSVQGIDFRPLNGVLYALGGDRVIYTINTANGAATALGGPLAIEGTLFGFDFNPVADAIRIVSNTNQNYRASPNTGALLGTDTNVFYSGSMQDPDITANAYVSGSTTQFAIDTAADTLVNQANNLGTLTTVGSLGVDVGPRTSFDIVGPDAFVFNNRTLYRADLETGGLTSLGRTTDDLFGIAIGLQGAVPEPASWAMMIIGFGAVGTALRRGKGKAAGKVSFA